MNVAIIYLRIIRRYNGPFKGPLPYEPSTLRFLKSYVQFKPRVPHDLIVVNCGADHYDRMFDYEAKAYQRYDGGGYDCGAYQHVGCKLNHDLILCLNTHAYFWRDRWLEPFMDACDSIGPGVYGATGSFEEHPHLRTPAIAFSPGPINNYPEIVDSRQKCGLFEYGPRNFALFSMSIGYPVRIVAGDGVYHLYDSNKIRNGFRDGDQSNVLIRDRHVDFWFGLNQMMRMKYSQGARVLRNGFPDERLLK